ncbi:MAG: DUF881 domain-containing protein [Anaerolineae bacterium]|jgi:uncharacterized protein YlxW (UPF0749 family)|nr:DUF881 domain-containing protein [Anaerolineae bacterium]
MQVSQYLRRIAHDHWVARILLAALFVLIGMLIFAQFRSESALRAARVAASGTDRAALISGLVDANLKLREEVDSLQAKLAELEQQGGSLVVMVEELNRLKLITGLSEVSGPGITLTLNSPVSATELQDMVNELKNSGAKAIALNGQRLIVSSAIVGTEAGIAVDGTLITRPFVFQVLGDPDTLRVALTRKGGMLASLQAAHPGFQADITVAPSVVIPIYARKIEFRYAQPVAVQ